MRQFNSNARKGMQEIIIQGRQRSTETEHEFVKRVYEYDEISGKMKRRIRIGGASKPGSAMGNLSKGYLRIAYKGSTIMLHRLIWFYQTGEWPEEQIDHINGIKHDNRWTNLRPASNSENAMNSDVRSDSKSKIRGVFIDKRCKYKKFRAHICVGGKRIWLGYFHTAEEAKAARIVAANRIHGKFAREKT